jgi:hypothetical protein
MKFSSETDLYCIIRGGSKRVKFGSETDSSCVIRDSSETDSCYITRGGSETVLAANPLYLYIIEIPACAAAPS